RFDVDPVAGVAAQVEALDGAVSPDHAGDESAAHERDAGGRETVQQGPQEGAGVAVQAEDAAIARVEIAVIAGESVDLVEQRAHRRVPAPTVLGEGPPREAAAAEGPRAGSLLERTDADEPGVTGLE